MLRCEIYMEWHLTRLGREITWKETHFKLFLFLYLFTFKPTDLYSCSLHIEKGKKKWLNQRCACSGEKHPQVKRQWPKEDVGWGSSRHLSLWIKEGEPRRNLQFQVLGKKQSTTQQPHPIRNACYYIGSHSATPALSLEDNDNAVVWVAPDGLLGSIMVPKMVVSRGTMDLWQVGPSGRSLDQLEWALKETVGLQSLPDSCLSWNHWAAPDLLSMPGG